MSLAGQSAGGRRKVLLYNPRAVFYTMPLGPLAVGSALDRSRYEVVLIDGRLHEDPVTELLRHLPEALCLGVSVLTGAPIRDAIRISRAARRLRPKLPIVWGGWHPSIFASECLEEPSVDVTVQGQGEDTFAELLERFETGGSLEGVTGCVFRGPEGRPHSNGERRLKDVGAFRRHDYALLEVERYFRLKGKRQMDFISSQGCNFRCGFCADPFVYNRQWVGLEPSRVGEEIEELWRRYRFDDLSFQDETYFTRAKRVQAVAEELLSRGLPITWAATMRADQGARLPDATLALCKRSGLRRVIIGVESGAQETLDRIQKDIRLEQVLESAEKCLRHAVDVVFPFIVGFPEEPDESVQASLDLAKKLRSMSPRFTTPVFQFKPYPGLPLTEEAVSRGFRLPETLEEWADFDFVGSVGPWVSPSRHRLVERFRFYQQLAWDRRGFWQRPLQSLARWRCLNDRYELPLEKILSEWLRPPQQLS